MLAIYRRHRSKCSQASNRASRRCRCSLWLTGTLFGEPYRKSAKTRSWEAAEKIKRDLEKREVGEPQPELVTIRKALAAFLADCESRNLHPNTLGKYRRLIAALTQFADRERLTHLADLSVASCRAFRESWKLSPRTSAKQLERLRAAFNFFAENGWIAKNPAKGIKAPKSKALPRLPFTDEEVRNITAQAKDDLELAFILTLRHTGLRIGDCALLRASQLTGNRIYLYTTKAGTPVSVVVPPHVVSLLNAISPRGGYFFLRGESTSMHTCADLWRRRIKIICKASGVFPDHPHRFRHTLAADLLSKGASIEDVAAILGNSPAIVQKYYSQWIRSRQDRLDQIVSQTWEKPVLRRVK